MAEKIVSTLKGKIKFEMDKSSLSRVKRTIKKMKDDLKGINGAMGMGGGGSGGSRTNRPQKNFEEYQKRTIKNFMISNKQIRSLADSEKDRLREVLKQAKTREELQDLMKRERATVQDRLAEERRITKEKQKQNVIQRRITGSTEQMVGALGSAFVAVEAFQSVVNTGIKFEAFEKTFLAVSDSSQDAANNMQFARDQAMRLGVDLIESGRAYSRMLGAAGSNTPADQIRDTFVAVSEASIAMGLSADDQMGVYRAMSQILSKQKFMAEEVRSQISDRGLPAMKILEQSARDAGLAVDEIGIDKLMEQGKLTTDLVLPFFAKNLRELANNNDALAKALEQNFQPALGRATNTLRDLSNEIFQGGLKDGLLFVLNTFSDLGKESKGLAQILGSVLGGAVMGLTFPFKLLYAAMVDIADFMGIKMNGDIIKMTSSIMGAVAGAILLGKALKLIGSAASGIKKVNDVLRSGKDNKNVTGRKGGVGTTAAAAAGGAYASTILKLASRLVAPTAAIMPSQLATGTLPNQQTNGLSQNEAINRLTQQLSQGNKIAIELNMNENAKDFVDARVTQGIQSEYEGVFETNGASKD